MPGQRDLPRPNHAYVLVPSAAQRTPSQSPSIAPPVLQCDKGVPKVSDALCALT